MPKLAARACRSRAHLLCLGAFGCLILFSLLSLGGRVVRGLQNESGRERLAAWPVAPYAMTYRWVEQRTRGHQMVGWVELPDAPQGYDGEKIAADVRQVIKPTWLSQSREPISLVTFAEGRDHDEVKAEIQGLGFQTVWMHPLSRVAVALEGRPERAPPRFPRVRARDHLAAGLKLFGLAALPAFLAYRRRRRRTDRLPDDLPISSPLTRLARSPSRLLGVKGGSLRRACLVLVGVPFALGLSAAAVDAFVIGASGSEIGTCIAFAGLILAWCAISRAVFSEEDEDLAEHPASIDLQSKGTFRLAAAALGLLACSALVLRFGLFPDGMIDSIAMYNARARAIVLDPSFMGPFRPPAGASALHPDYPPALAFAVAGAYRIAGSFSTVAPIFVQLCFWLGGGGLVALWAQRRAGRGAVLAVIALLAVLPHWQERVADQCCDVPLGLTWVSAMTLWYRRRSVPTALATGALLGGCLLLKNEGLLLVGAWLAAVILTAPKTILARPRRASALLAGLAPAALLGIIFTANVPPSDILGRLSMEHITPERSLKILQRFWQIAVWPGTYGWTFAVVGGAYLMMLVNRVISGLRGDRLAPIPESVRALPLTLLGATAGFFCVYASSPFDIEWILQTSSDRIFAQLFPATVMLGVGVARLLAFEPRNSPGPVRSITTASPTLRRRVRTPEDHSAVRRVAVSEGVPESVSPERKRRFVGRED